MINIKDVLRMDMRHIGENDTMIGLTSEALRVVCLIKIAQYLEQIVEIMIKTKNGRLD